MRHNTVQICSVIGREAHMSSSSYEWHRLVFPAQLEADPVVGFVRGLAVRPRHGLPMISLPIIVEVDGSNHRLTWRLGLPSSEANQVLSLLRAHLPNVRHEIVQREHRIS